MRMKVEKRIAMTSQNGKEMVQNDRGFVGTNSDAIQTHNRGFHRLNM
jgi:hypothetical protein